MVEKIIINPNKVRGYGNIMSPHSSSDYEVYMSSISSGTDTVNGQTMTVYELEDTILFFDKGTTASHNDNWSYPQYMTRTDTGTIINNTSGAALFDAVRLNNSNLPFVNDDLTVEFELLENNSSMKFRFDGQTLCEGETLRQHDFSFAANETGKFKFVYDKENNTIVKYKNGAYVETITHHFCGNMGFLFRLDNGKSLKYKDFIIY